MSRRAPAILLALLAGALAAAKPVPQDDGPRYTSPQPTSAAWRSQGVPVCVDRLRANRALTPDDLETICGCTFDTYLEGHGNNPLPGLATDHIPIALEHQLLICTARTRPDQRAAVRELNAVWPRAYPPPAGVRQPPAPEIAPLDGKPADVDVGPAETGEGSGGGFWQWLENLSWPAWLTGASMLWWVAIGIFLFGLLILKIRRRDPRNDLVGPPSHMRRGAPPQPPRRPDLPR